MKFSSYHNFLMDSFSEPHKLERYEHRKRVIVFIRNITPNEILEKHICSNYTEYLFTKINFRKLNWFPCGTYQPPSPNSIPYDSSSWLRILTWICNCCMLHIRNSHFKTIYDNLNLWFKKSWKLEQYTIQLCTAIQTSKHYTKSFPYDYICRWLMWSEVNCKLLYSKSSFVIQGIKLIN